MKPPVEAPTSSATTSLASRSKASRAPASFSPPRLTYGDGWDRSRIGASSGTVAPGFVTGRSTVTNARPHLGSKLLVKFDLRDFFPTIHYYRVLGLFARLGYAVDDARFGTADDSRRVAPTLARLCS